MRRLNRWTLVGLAVSLAPLLLEGSARVRYRLELGEWPRSLAQEVRDSLSSIDVLFVEHPLLPFVLRPNASANFMDTRAHVNSAGLRGPALRPNPSLRLLAVGGSRTFDTGVSDDAHTWVAQLERELSSAVPGVEVVNGGVPVYGTWANALKYSLYDAELLPDLALVHQGLNDTVPWWPRAFEALLAEDYWMYRGVSSRVWSGVAGRITPFAAPRNTGWLAHSVLYFGAFNRRGTNRNVFADMALASDGPAALPSQVLAANRRMFRHFLATLRADGVQPVFVPESIGNRNRRQVHPNHPAWVDALTELNRAYAEECAKADVPVVDVTAVMSAWGDEWFRDALHFNDRGAETFARLVAERLPGIPGFTALAQRGLRAPRTLPTSLAVSNRSRPRSANAGRIDLREPHNLLSSVLVRLDGFGATHGPFPDWNLHRRVRWLQAPRGRVEFEAAESAIVSLRVRFLSYAVPQKLTVKLDGQAVISRAYSQRFDGVTEERSQPLSVAAGPHLIEIEGTAAVVEDGGRSNYLLFEELGFVR